MLKASGTEVEASEQIVWQQGKHEPL